MTKNDANLARDIIFEHFGDNVAKVCQCLIQGGQLTLPDVIRSTKLSPSVVRNCLLVLIQHNCVQAFRYELEASESVVKSHSQNLYLILLNNILNRLRFPKFLMHITTSLGPEPASLVEGLLEHGRLSVEQILLRARAHSDVAAGEATQVEAGNSSMCSSFLSLVSNRYLERCPLPEPVLPARQITDVAKKAMRGGWRSRAAVQSQGYFESVEERVLRRAQQDDTDRFRIPASVVLAADQAPAGGVDEGSLPLPAVSVGGKRKRVDLLEGGDVEVTDVLWRVNCAEFLRFFRHTLCVSLVRERFDSHCAMLLSTWLSSDRATEAPTREQFSSSKSAGTLLELPQQPVGPAAGQAAAGLASRLPLSLERVRSALAVLAPDASGSGSGLEGDPLGEGVVVKHAETGAPTFSINLNRIVALAQMKEVEALIRHRFGPPACRIFRLLLQRRQLEQKQIGELSMLPAQETREHLYKMLQEGYVSLQEVAKSADHAPSRTFFLWRVSLPEVTRAVLDHVLLTACNLRLRLRYELRKEQEVMQLLEASASRGRGSAGPHIHLTAGQRKRIERIRRVATILEVSLLRLDDTVMLFSCF